MIKCFRALSEDKHKIYRDTYRDSGFKLFRLKAGLLPLGRFTIHQEIKSGLNMQLSLLDRCRLISQAVLRLLWIFSNTHSNIKLWAMGRFH